MPSTIKMYIGKQYDFFEENRIHARPNTTTPYTSNASITKAPTPPSKPSAAFNGSIVGRIMYARSGCGSCGG